ncbi:radical SAM protein [Candidatus Micrarchaeota archaeon]|nr:radical SAM protein [Candidatus Micrarchaeota archaeon]MBD3418240.1 radical SAM protein [Candidatus Micrarchaeota archaeon]
MVSAEKVRALSELASYDMEQEEQLKHIPLGEAKDTLHIYEAKTPRGSCTLFKTLMTNNCKMDCRYCVNANCSKRKAAWKYTPIELASTFMALYKKRMVQGLFLSSSIEDPISSMESILESARLLRAKMRYRGYMHLKILPGSTRDQVERAIQYADRVSINLETVSPSRLSEIASNKDFKNDILKRQAWIRSTQSRFKHSRETGSAPTRVSHVSQLMVGINGESDLDIFTLAASEYDHMKLNRMYYSAFRPVMDTHLERTSAAPIWRQNRLYQLDWLYRIYSYSRDEVQPAFSDNGFLHNTDPKVAIARTTFERPLEINGAEERDLLRVPGIGPKTAKSLAKAREKITSMAALRKHGVVLGRALPFIRINGLHQTTLASFN